MRLPAAGLLFFCLTLASAHALIYKIKKGDTLASVSRQHHVTIEDLADINHLDPSDPLRIGQKIIIPDDKKTEDSNASEDSESESNDEDSSSIYVVKRGDTWSSIAHKHHLHLAELKAANPSHPVLKPGQKLHLPVSKKHKGEKSVAAAPRYYFINSIKAQLDEPKIKPGRWKYVVLHHSGTPSGNAKIFEYFHRYVRGMENGLAYHFVIGNGHGSEDGEIQVGNRWVRQIKGGHLHSDELNEISLGICFVGNFNEERPTPKQIAAAIELVSYLNKICGARLILKAHREINPRPTQCPGKLFPIESFHRLFG